MSTESIKAENGQSTVEPEGGEVLGIPSIGETLGGLAAPLTHGQAVTREAVRLGGELARVAVGRSEVAPAKGDRRFSDPAWSGNPLFNRIQRGYLAAAGALTNVVEDYAEGTDDSRRAEQARFASNILISTLAPTNYLPTNPAALKRAFDTGGRSLARGLGHFVDDLRNNGGMPRMVDPDAFEVGRNLALSPGAVVAARPDGRGAAVPADHRAGVRAAAAHHPAADQPLLRRRPQPGPQLRRVRREDRASRPTCSAGATRPSSRATGTSTATRGG